MHRRDFLLSNALLAPAAPAYESATSVVVDPAPQFEISPWLYMQFMEPLGTTDGSVEAAWDYDRDDWREDLIATTRDLAPGALRWGGIFCRYYKWREGVGPAAARPWMRNYAWGGKETNRVGTHEFVDFCRRVGAEPLICVNFLSDGHKQYWNTREGNRSGDAREAADWVSYANDPDDKLRLSHGVRPPYHIKLWQLGNETSYGAGGFSKDESIRHTIEFAKAMRARDPSIRLIGWGDWQRGVSEDLWAAGLLERAGEHLDFVAIHMMGQRPLRKDTVLRGTRYQTAVDQAWEELLEMSRRIEERVAIVEQVVASKKSRAGIAITEGHLSLSPHNINPILLEWLTGVFHARTMNIYQRRGARVKIATAADFCGNRWTVNAVLMQMPRGVSFLTPAGAVMRLFKRHNGTHGANVERCPSALDIAASVSPGKVWLHVANTSLRAAQSASFEVKGRAIRSGRVFEIAPEDVRQAASQDQPQAFMPRERPLPGTRWSFPAASVSAVELEIA